MRQFHFLIAGMASVMILGCSKKNAGDPPIPSKYDVNKYAVNNTVCNPLSGGGQPAQDPNHGIHATLTYLSAGQPRYSTVSNVMNHGVKSNQDLFFSEINVPTRMFTEGFPTQSGSMVKDDQGNDLLEYFAIRFEGVVHLGPEDASGDYQLALLSDDGAVMSLSSNLDGENYQVVVNDDNVHPTKMGCGPIVAMSKDTNLSMRIDYFQGPRYHIALIPLWRPVNSCTPAETLCGAEGNSTFFDPNNGSKPLSAYMKLLADGWRPLSADNYSVSPSTNYNPCVSGTAPQISNLNVTFDNESNQLFVTWITDIPATDQVLITNTASGDQTLTPSDNLLRTSHLVKVAGVIQAGVSYSVQAVSISQDLGKTLSPAQAFTLQ